MGYTACFAVYDFLKIPYTYIGNILLLILYINNLFDCFYFLLLLLNECYVKRKGNIIPTGEYLP